VRRVPVASETINQQELQNLKVSISEPIKTQIPPPPPPPAPPVSSSTQHYSASIVPTTGGKAKSENLLDNEDTPTHPDDYLESSEALLRSLTEEQAPTKKPSHPGDSLLSPLGIGSMLLLLIASLTLGYVVFNPKSLPQFNLAGIFKGNSSEPAGNTPVIGSNNIPTPEPTLTAVPKYPNLANDEFSEVNSPNDIVNLKPKAKATSTVGAKPINRQPVAPEVGVQTSQIQTIPTTIAKAPVQPLPSLAPSNLPQVTGSTTLPTNPTAITSATTTPTPINLDDIKASGDGFYHIVTDNQNDRALKDSQQFVRDAYLSPDGKLIYLGALKSKKEVKQLLKELQSKGINARVE
jgi:hypothetical protein